MFDRDVAVMYGDRKYIEEHVDELKRDFEENKLRKDDPLFLEIKRKVENGEIYGEIYADGSIRLLR